MAITIDSRKDSTYHTKTIEKMATLQSESYHDKYICFFDVLGSKDLLLNSVSPKDAVLPNIFMNEMRDSAENYGMKFDVVLFSDCAYIIASEESVKDLLIYVSILTSKLLLQSAFFPDEKYKHHLLKGGLTFGKVYADSEMNYAVGPGVVNAYLLEESAKFPKILVDKKLVDRRDIKQLVDERYIIYDENDEKYYVNFLHIVHITRKIAKASLNEPLEWLVKMESKYRDGTNGDAEIAKKYEWMISYVNGILKQLLSYS